MATENKELKRPASNATQKPAKRNKNALPTTDEQLQLQQSTSLIRSNILRLQVDEILGEVKYEKIFKKKQIKDWIQLFTDKVKTLPSSKSALTAEWLAASAIAGIELQGSTKDTCSLNFVAPTSVDTIGSFSLQTMTFPYVNIDLVCTMPAELFDHKDIANHSYFNKRALYLAALGEKLSGAGFSDLIDSESIQLSAFKGDTEKPILILKPTISIKSAEIIIRIIPVVSAAVFRFPNFNPSRNNTPLSLATTTNPSDTLAQTAYYNMSIAEDMTMISQHRLLAKTLELFPAARDATLLLKVWLTQRGMRFAVDGLDGHSAGLLMAYLFQTRRISLASSALAAFQFAMSFVAETDLTKVLLNFRSVELVSTTSLIAPRPWALTLSHPVVGKTAKDVMEFNCLWRVSASSYQQLRDEAAHTLRLLQHTGEAAFNQLFIQPKPFFQRYDLFFHLPAALASSSSVQSSRELLEVNASVSTLMEKALGTANRVQAVQTQVCIPPASSTPSHVNSQSSHLHLWNLRTPLSPVSAASRPASIAIGVILDSEQSHRRVERGPEADPSSDTLSAFREFWGEKCQLRRFQDGSIVEAVIWDATVNGVADPKNLRAVPKGEDIVEQIVRYILGLRMPALAGENGQRVFSGASRFEHILPCGVDHSSVALVAATTKLSSSAVAAAAASRHQRIAVNDDPRIRFDAETLTRHAVEALDRLRNTLVSGITGLPLAIETVMALSPALRYTALYPPVPHPLVLGTKDALKEVSGQQISLLVQPLSVLGTLESSVKWPVEEEAILNSFTAFILRISDLLWKQFQIKSTAQRTWLDIHFEGYIFRLNLVMKGAAASLTETETVTPTVSAISAVSMTSSDLEQAHHQAIRGLHALFPSYAPALRLLTLWVHNNMLSGQLSVQTLELLVASVYRHPDRSHAPSCPTAGFLQALKRIGDWDWCNDPLVIDFSTEMKAVDVTRTVTHFRQQSHRRVLQLLPCYSAVAGALLPEFVHEPAGPALALLVQAAKRTFDAIQTSSELLPVDATVSPLGSITTGEEEVLQHCNVLLSFRKPLVCPTSSAAATAAGAANSAVDVDAVTASGSVSGLMETAMRGPAFASLGMFANLPARERDTRNLVIRDFSLPSPVQAEMVEKLREEFGHLALFFWNEIRGDLVGLVWKPKGFAVQTFSILDTTNKLVMSDKEKKGSCITVNNVTEIVAEMIDLCDGTINGVQFR